MNDSKFGLSANWTPSTATCQSTGWVNCAWSAVSAAGYLAVGNARMVRPVPVVQPLPAGCPGVWDLDRLAVVGGELARTEVGAEAAQVVALRLEAPLDDLLRVETGLRRVLSGLVDG